MKKFLIIFFLLFTPLGYAQEPLKDGMFVLDNFSNGLNTKNSAFTLKKEESDTAENIRLDTEQGSFAKRDNTITYVDCGDDPILGMHRFYMKSGDKLTLVNYSDSVSSIDESTETCTELLDLTTGDRKAQWITWHDLAIGTDGYNQPYKYDGTSSSATYLGSALALDAGSGAGPDGTYTYKVTCYTSSYELSLDTASNSVIVTDNDISLSMIPICPDTYLGEDVTGRKIYRTEDSGSTYKLLSNGTIADNTSTTLTDSDADGALGATLSPTATTAPPKGKISLIHSNRLWIFNNPDNPSRAYYSDDSSHDYFPAANYLDIRQNDGDEITFAKNLLGKLTVGKNNTIQKIYTDGTPADDWEISDPFSSVGCHAIYSAVNTPIGIIYLSNNGLYVFNGQHSKLISDQVTPEIKDINPSNFVNVWGEYYKNAYYMTYTSIRSGETSNNRVLVYDLINKAYSIDLLDIDILHVFRSGTDIEALYSGSSTDGTVYAHTETVRELVHRVRGDFIGTFDDMRYIPDIAGGSSDSPVLELAWDVTIDSISATIDSITWGIIDRPATGGSYTSQVLNLNSSNFDKLYWNETIPGTGGDVRFRLRSATSDSTVTSASWSDYVSNPAGSDISQFTANTYVQYYISMDTTEIEFTPTVYRAGNYAVRLTYNTVGSVGETTIPINYRSGWLDLGYPAYRKTLTQIFAYYESESTGTLNITVESLYGDSDLFAIDLQTYPSSYNEHFTTGRLLGEFFRINIQEDSLNDLVFKKLILVFDLEPLYQ